MATPSLPPESDADRTERFVAAINRQGHAFQNAMLRHIQKLRTSEESPWVFEAAEFPVEVRSHDTRIDFVLAAYRSDCWILAECKRVNPDYSDWCFWRTPFVHRNPTETYIAEIAALTSLNEFNSGGMQVRYLNDGEALQVALSVKTPKDGANKKDFGSSDDAIERAASQACTGMNGMVEFLRSHMSSLGPNRQRILLPVIFTTAKLWVCDAEMASAEVTTGDMDAQKSSFHQVDYALYQYHISPGIKHQADSRDQFASLSSILATESIRTIPIVTPAGVSAFLRKFDPDMLKPERIVGQ